MDSLAAAMKAEEKTRRGDKKREVKFQLEDIEAPEWEQDPPIGTKLPNVTDNRLVSLVKEYVALVWSCSFGHLSRSLTLDYRHKISDQILAT